MVDSATARVTSVDVARHAGVAQSTVSLVLSGKAAGRISPRLQERVLDAATDLGYRPSHAARALREGRTRALGLLVPDITNPFLGLVMHGAQEQAWANDHAVVLMESGPGRERHRRAVDALRGGLVGGLLLFAVPASADVRRQHGPTVLIEVEQRDLPSVVLDAEGGLRDAVGHLRALGHRRVGYLGVGNGRWTFQRRKRSWVKVMRQAGLEIDQRWCAEASLDVEGARGSVRQLFASANRPTALICADDLLAAGAYAAARDVGLSVPEDISVVGFAGTVVGQVLAPTLTTVVAPAGDLGSTGVRLLLGAMAGEASPRRAVLPVAFHEGASTAQPAPRATGRRSRR